MTGGENICNKKLDHRHFHGWLQGLIAELRGLLHVFYLHVKTSL